MCRSAAGRDPAPPWERPLLATTGDAACCVSEGTYVLWNFSRGAQGEFPRPMPEAACCNTFSHPLWPMLSFTYPNGWTAQEITVRTASGMDQRIGVYLTRIDGAALYKEVTQMAVTGPVPGLDALVEANLADVLERLGVEDPAQVFCTQTGYTNTYGVEQAAKAVVAVAGPTTLYIASGVTTAAGVTNILFQAYAGPSDEYASLTYEVFFNIILQRIPQQWKDRDKDGYPDAVDRFPADPDRH